MTVLPYLGKLLLQIRTRVDRVIRNKLPYCNLKIAFQTKCKLIIFLHSKIPVCIPVFLRSVIAQKFKCGGCNATYCGKTKRHIKVRMSEHIRISALTGKNVQVDNNHSSGFDDFPILASNSNDFNVTLMESFLINRDHPPLNKSRHLLPLQLFDD